MQLKFQRSQRAGGAFGKTVIFCLDARAEYSPAETTNISKYKLGGEVVYNSQAAKRHLESMNRHLDRVGNHNARETAAGLARGFTSLALAKMSLNISIASLGRGHHIECKDLPELLDAEKALMDACRSLKEFLAAAATFNGSVILVDFDDNEKIHIAQGAVEVVAALPAPPPPAAAVIAATTANVGWGDEASLIHGGNPDPVLAGEEIINAFRQEYRDHPGAITMGGSVLLALFAILATGAHTWSFVLGVALVATAAIWSFRR